MSFEIKHFYRFGDYTVDPDQKVLLRNGMPELRKSLGDNARKPQFIETVPRRGYRFIADVEEISNGSGNIGREMPLKSFDHASEAGSIQDAGNIDLVDARRWSWCSPEAGCFGDISMIQKGI